MRTKKKRENVGINVIKVIVFLIFVIISLNMAPNYIKENLNNKINLIINNKNVTKSLKKDIFISEEGTIYLSKEDVQNFFDESIYYDEKYNQIITTYENKIASMGIDKKDIYVNDSKVNIYSSVISKDETYYIPFSEVEDVYNVELKYIEDEKIITLDSLNRQQKIANSAKKTAVRYMPTVLSKKVDKIEKGERVIVINEDEDGWVKIRTEKGKIGFIKSIANVRNLRDTMEYESQVNGKISMVWDYFSEYSQAPDRQNDTIKGVNVISPSFAVLKKDGDGTLLTNIGEAGKRYISWAKSKNYKVWAMISNNSMIDTTSKIVNDYELRTKLINNIVELAIQNNFDGINIDFENMYEKDKEMFSRFIIELAPRLREYGMILSVDVTAPDGAGTWSMCFDRNEIAKAADYIVFMGYDQYGVSSPKQGTTAGADWVEVNIKKFLGQEDVDGAKLILGVPFYTRLWKEENGKTTSSVISMGNIDEQIPDGVEKKWDEDLKQYYVEFKKGNASYKIWIEDEKSISAKLNLVEQYDLAGAAYWAKDRENGQMWNLIEKNFKK
ncbi:MAG: glycosyl hydrolase family 18 protein [Clostridia bacterium]|nr:glycosyl hydrolase family 18 protein [Clostridia bacterium]